MRSSKYSNRSSSTLSSNHQHRSPPSSDYEYVGRLVTRERARHQPSASVQDNRVYYPQNKYSTRADRRDLYEEVPVASENDDADDVDGLSRPLGVIRINDRHVREIYRLPTPPPKVKRVFHRLRSPEPKIIERVYVRRPQPQIIENVIEVPPEKVKIIHREKVLDPTKPITRSKLIHLKSRHREERQYSQVEPVETHLSSQQQHISTVPLNGPQPSTATTLVYPPQADLPTVGYFQSDIPPHIMLNSQQPMQLPTQQSIHGQMTMNQAPTFSYSPIAAYPSQQPQTIPYDLYGYKQH